MNIQDRDDEELDGGDEEGDKGDDGAEEKEEKAEEAAEGEGDKEEDKEEGEEDKGQESLRLKYDRYCRLVGSVLYEMEMDEMDKTFKGCFNK